MFCKRFPATLFVSLILACSAPCQVPQSNWVNVKDYGAVGDGVTDDTNAILRAINAAIDQQLKGGNVVYFPPGGSYSLPHGLALPWTKNVWVTLYLDAPLGLGGTLDMQNFYDIQGHSGGQGEAFSRVPLGFIGVGYGVNPAIRFRGVASARLDNLQITYIKGDADGISIEPSSPDKGQSADISLNNVYVDMDGNNKTGSPLVIRGGFGYDIEGGSYAVPFGSTAPGILIEDDPIACNLTGIITISGAFLDQRGIKITGRCGGVEKVDIRNILMELPVAPLLTIDQAGLFGVYNIRIDGASMADEPPPGAPILEVRGTRVNGVNGVTISHSSSDYNNVTTGDAVKDLEVWWENDNAKIAQKTGYVLHMPSKIVNTMPTVTPTSPAPPATGSTGPGQAKSGPRPGGPEPPRGRGTR